MYSCIFFKYIEKEKTGKLSAIDFITIEALQINNQSWINYVYRGKGNKSYKGQNIFDSYPW